jgi:hypothetical protein
MRRDQAVGASASRPEPGHRHARWGRDALDPLGGLRDQLGGLLGATGWPGQARPPRCWPAPDPSTRCGGRVHPERFRHQALGAARSRTSCTSASQPAARLITGVPAHTPSPARRCLASGQAHAGRSPPPLRGSSGAEAGRAYEPSFTPRCCVDCSNSHKLACGTAASHQVQVSSPQRPSSQALCQKS